MKRESVEAELYRLDAEHAAKLWRQNPDLTPDAAAEIVVRRTMRDIGMTRIEIARANAAYRDYLAAPQSRSKKRKKGAR
jgi:hypothetical protein